MAIVSSETPTRPPPRSTNTFDLAAGLLGVLVISGLYLDGWAHNHHRVDQSFFTPWHAVLYFSIALTGAFFFVAYARNRMRGAHRRDALPPGYLLSMAGVGLFLIGGIADLVWHSFFGIERDTAALLSPTHLVLAIAGMFIVSGPWRAAFHALPRGSLLTWGSGLPLVLSAASVIAIAVFITQFTHPVVDTLSTREEPSTRVASDIYVMDADGSHQTRLTVEPDAWHSYPVWSPDGRRLLLAVGVKDQPTDLWVMNADGTGEIQLTHTPGDDFSPSWSRDGSQIAFLSEARSSGRTDNLLMVVNADGSNARVLTTTSGRKFGTTWSPDGRTIAFSARQHRVWQIFAIDLNTGDVRQLTSGSADSLSPAWSPDGRSIALSRNSGRGYPLIYLMDADGTHVQGLPRTVGGLSPSWSPTGTALAYTTFRGNRGDISVVDFNGPGERNLTQGAGLSYDLSAFSPDGAHIALAAAVPQRGNNRELMRRLGVSSILLQTVVLVAPLLLVLRRWSLPFGSIALVLLLTSLGAAVLKDHYDLVPGAVLVGLVADVVLRRARSEVRLRLFATVLPAAFYSFYFATLSITDRIDWTIHLWAGSIVMAAIAGFGMSYLAEATGPDARPTSVADAP